MGWRTKPDLTKRAAADEGTMTKRLEETPGHSRCEPT